MIAVADLSPLILPCLQHSQSLSPKLAQILVHACVCVRARVDALRQQKMLLQQCRGERADEWHMFI